MTRFGKIRGQTPNLPETLARAVALSPADDRGFVTVPFVRA
jgi:hypothetical protein